MRPRADSYEELPSPELERDLGRDLVPVPKAAASIIESPAPLELELVRVHPATTADEEPAPPPTPYEQATPSVLDVSAPPPTPYEQPSSPREPQVSQPLLLEEIAPSNAEATVAQAQTDAAPAPPAAVQSDPAAPPAEPPVASPTAAKSTGETSSSEPTSDRKPEDAAPQTTTPPAATASVVEAEPTIPEPPVVTSRPHRGRLFVGLAALWVITATIPAIVVWQVMRKAAPVQSSLSVAEYCAKADPRARANDLPPRDETSGSPTASASGVVTVPVGAPSAAASVDDIPSGPSNTPPASSATGVPSDPSGAASAATIPSDRDGAPSAAAVSSAVDPATAGSAPVVVETQSDDRINVLVRSNPDGMRIYRRGKVIGRTPLVIQIGRGDRRVFEVGTPSLGNKRISLDGEKTEVLVNMVGDAKAAPAPVSQPATMPDRMHERLR